MALLRAKPMRQRSDKQARFERELSTAKTEILGRARYSCELCGDRSARLDAHHPFSRRELGAWTNHPSCLVVVCAKDHRAITDASNPTAHRLKYEAQAQVVLRLAEMAGVESVLDDLPGALKLQAMQLTDLLGEPT